MDGIARKNSWLHHSFRATRHTCYKILRKHLSPVMVFPMLDGVFVRSKEGERKKERKKNGAFE